MKLDLWSLAGQARIDRMKAVMAQPEKDRGIMCKVVVPDGIGAVTYDMAKKSFEASPADFTPDAAVFVTKLKASDDPHILDFTVSTERRDRDGDRIAVNGWDLKEWKRNSLFMWAHGASTFPPGVGLKAWKESAPKGLRSWILFPQTLESEEAQKFTDMIYAYYSHKPPLLKAISPGFRPLEVDFGATPEEKEKLDIGQYGAYISKAELWEMSGCPLGSGYDALIMGVAQKMYGDKATGLLDSLGFEIPTGSIIVKMEHGVVGKDAAIIPLASGGIPAENKSADSGNSLDKLSQDVSSLGMEMKMLKDSIGEIKALLVPATSKDQPPAPPQAGQDKPPESENSSGDILEDLQADNLDKAAEDVYSDLLDEVAETVQPTAADADEPKDIFDEI